MSLRFISVQPRFAERIPRAFSGDSHCSGNRSNGSSSTRMPCREWTYRALLVRVILCGAVAGLLSPTHTQGQAPSNNRNRDVVDGMVRTLMDSQSLDNRPGPIDSGVRVAATSPQMREVRANLAGFSQELSQLITQLHQDVNRTSGLRSLMGEALQVSAQANLLARQANQTDDMNAIITEFSNVDQDWRLLAFRLQKIRNLNPQAIQNIDRANQFSASLGQLMQVKPQLNESEITRQVSTLSADLMRLLEEIDYEVSDSASRYTLLLEGKRVYEQSRRMSQLASQTAYEEDLRVEYQRFRSLWNPYLAKIRPMQLSYVDRQLQRVQATDRKVQELLLLPVEVDRTELIYLTQLLQRDIDRLMDGLNLRSLTKLTRGRDKIITASSDFYAACSDFADCVRNGESTETMAELYHYLENNWMQVADILRDTPSSETRQAYRQLDRSITDIRDILSVQPNFDRRRAGELAAEVDNLASYFDYDLRGVLAGRTSSAPASLRTECLNASQSFRIATAKLQADLQSNARMKTLQDQTASVIQSWKTLLQLTDRLSAADREPLDRTRRQLTPVLIDLQAMLLP